MLGWGINRDIMLGFLYSGGKFSEVLGQVFYRGRCDKVKQNRVRESIGYM